MINFQKILRIAMGLVLWTTGVTSADVIAREEVFEFAQTPAITNEGDKYIITFAVTAKCDATVSIVDKTGKVVCHLASGVLGANAPAPFLKDSLSQRLEWYGRDDQGKPAPDSCVVRVSLGLKADYDMDIAWRPGNYFTKGDGTSYLRTYWPPPAETPEATMSQFGISYATTIWGDKVPCKKGVQEWFSIFSTMPATAQVVLSPLFGTQQPPRTASSSPVPVITSYDWFSGQPRMAVNPRTEDLYVNVGSNRLFRLDGETGRFDSTFFLNTRLDNMSEFDVGPDDLLYICSGPFSYAKYLFRLDRQGVPVSFADGNTTLTSTISPEPQNGWWSHFPTCFYPSPVSALTDVIPTGKAGHSNVHDKGFDVSITGTIVGMFAEMSNDFMAKYIVPTSFHRVIQVWDADGKRATARAITPDTRFGHGVRMDRDGNIYAVRAATMPPNQGMLDGITDVTQGYRVFGGHGSLIKFASRGGEYPLDEGEGIPVSQVCQGDNPGGAANLTFPGALWVYGGVTDQMSPDCSCNHTRFDLDGWARSWIPARQLQSVVVLDANGNRIARIGRYGNVDDEGIRFAWVRSVAVSDKALYAMDYCNRRILKARLGYNREATAAVSGAITVVLTPRRVTLSPSTASVAPGNSFQFNARALDQFNMPIAAPLHFTVSGGGSIDTNGLFKSSGEQGAFTVRVSLASDASLFAETPITVSCQSINLALGKPVDVSSFHITYPASFAVDDNAGTYWSSLFTDSQSITINLNASVTVEKVVLLWEESYAKEYYIRVWNDGVGWTDVKHETAGNGGNDTITVDAKASKVMMFGAKKSDTYGFALYEFKVFASSCDSGLTGIQNESASAAMVPMSYALSGAFPNPFRQTTDIKFGVPFSKDSRQEVLLQLFDVKGRLLKTLVQGSLKAGYHRISVTTGNTGADMVNGVYFCRMQAPGYKKTMKLVVVR